MAEGAIAMRKIDVIRQVGESGLVGVCAHLSSRAEIRVQGSSSGFPPTFDNFAPRSMHPCNES